MTGLSTREQICAEAIERIARGEFDFEARPLTPDPGDWDALAAEVQDRYLQRAAFLVDALDGLLPTGIEWGIRYEAPDLSPRMDNPSGISTHTRPLPSEAHARASVENGVPIRVTNRRAVSRYAHDWIEVADRG